MMEVERLKFRQAFAAGECLIVENIHQETETNMKRNVLGPLAILASLLIVFTMYDTSERHSYAKFAEGR